MFMFRESQFASFPVLELYWMRAAVGSPFLPSRSRLWCRKLADLYNPLDTSEMHAKSRNLVLSLCYHRDSIRGVVENAIFFWGIYFGR